jgi:Fe-S-cluster containining protein
MPDASQPVHATSTTLAKPHRHWEVVYHRLLDVLPFSGILLKLARRLRYKLLPYKEEPLRGKHTLRTGHCNQCGECCKNLFLSYGRETIRTEEEFREIQARHPEDYQFFEPMYATEFALAFRCNNLGPDNLCMDYEARPGFCRTYPTEEGILLGSRLPKECGFAFAPLKAFEDVLKQTYAEHHITLEPKAEALQEEVPYA